MRDKLLRQQGRRGLFRATFWRYGQRATRAGVNSGTVLLRDIETSKGVKVTDHLWMSSDKPFRRLDLEKGDVIEFTAKVESYHKITGEVDYKLSLPTSIRRVE